MIPKVMPPLAELTVLVTRPASQAAGLCEQLGQHGAAAIAFPAVEIAPLTAAAASGHDLIVFVSVNAVAHGVQLIEKAPTARVAAIGRATAAALAQTSLPADIVPEAGFNSEALLAHPDLTLGDGARVLIVRGDGGRELLQESFTSRGLVVETREVYKRVRPTIDDATRQAVELRWANEGIDVVTATSIETLHNLIEILSDRGRALLRETALLVASRRIAEAAQAAGLNGTVIVANGADDASMIGALANWRTRARAA
ncbi:uroporphyrinogen-III synthase [Steroidobacter sp.]|uniref:uroporphyrinogen-III synthase n=1 Tax=Steroidobacter sp. TaxID=1978227 RepID=UPI001A3B7C2E|nr:uroporphyrinogen-III synthase [Steroidobacter sp.]MBL8264942.1 uroporphyrinogen-III synthase [Steroidobacter sp.]